MCDTPFNPTFLICRSISNIIYSVIFGHRVDYQDEDCEMFLGLLAENLKLVDTFWVQDEDKQHVPHVWTPDPPEKPTGYREPSMPRRVSGPD
ncbi:cytochrome P450 2F1-like isoform X3 [Hippopotamus amphibius kiboko]|uniref:cytochrome P450 2F1-like isoform X3 n=1 Tax=Hippopotamus amphibius kiboko TaxID=575201 RepID=UPI002592CEC4|nr:cytochrome P450 2F1-like isoform X3 [Hippopotamus amphibius kiboko]